MNKQEAEQRLSDIEKEVVQLKKIIDTAGKPTPEERFWQLCDGIVLRIDKVKYPNSFLFFKGDDFVFEYNIQSGLLWVRSSLIWEVFEKEYNLIYDEIRSIIKKQVEEHFKIKSVTPVTSVTDNATLVEEHFKIRGVTPIRYYEFDGYMAEKHFKNKQKTITLKQVVDWEVKSCTLFQSYLYRLFPNFFFRKCKRKLRRYKELEKEQATQDIISYIKNYKS